jgi:hypothetical protein
MNWIIALALAGLAFAMIGCTLPPALPPTGVAAPGHNWLEGGGG